MPPAELEFESSLRRWYLGRGVAAEDPLLRHWVGAMGPQTYLAGHRVVREVSAIEPLSGKRLLDAGCGFGGVLLAAVATGARAFGVDANEQELALCRQRLALHGSPCAVACADGFHLPFEPSTFDVVVSTEVLEHIRRRDLWIQELCRVLRPGGVLYLSFPNLLSLRNLFRDPHYNLFGVTALPVALARRYTRLRLGHDYDVEQLPITRVVARICAANGVRAYSVVHSEEVLLRKIETPETIQDRRMRAAFAWARTMGLAPLMKALVRLKATTGPSGVLAGFKR